MPQEITVTEIPRTSSSALAAASKLVTKYSWGEAYPVSPLAEIKGSEFCVGAWNGKRLIGFSAVNRNASPDGVGNGSLWFGYAVVVPEFRNRGVFRRLYAACLDWIQAVPGDVFACTDNPIMISFLVRHGWQFDRRTHDESGGTCLVFKYPQARRTD